MYSFNNFNEKERCVMIMIEGNKNTVTIANECPWCGKLCIFKVPTEGYTKWRLKNALVQDAFPDMPSYMREYFLSGFCKKCQEKIFGEE